MNDEKDYAIFNTKFATPGADYRKYNGQIVEILDTKKIRWDTRYTIKFKDGLIVDNIITTELETDPCEVARAMKKEVI